MDTLYFITHLRQAGFTISLVDGNLAVRPASHLNDDQRQCIRAHKPEIIVALRASDAVLDTGQTGNDLPASNEILPLPIRLAAAATRVCREIHGDDDQTVATMLDDLRTQPDDWDALAEHFEQQLPPPPQPGHERRRMQAAGYEFDIDVPVRTSIKFDLRDGQGGGIFAGSGLTVEQRRQKIIAMYGGRLATIDGLEVDHDQC
jgi:TubC N-terminal docking domain